MPFPHADRLVWIENNGGGAAAGALAGARSGGNAGPSNLSGRTSRALTFHEWRALNKSFEDVGGYFAFYNYGSAKLTLGGRA